MHIAIVGPLATADLGPLLDQPPGGLPAGYAGAPFMGSLVAELLAAGHTVTAITVDASLPLSAQGVVRAQCGGLQVVFCPSRPRAWAPNGLKPGRIVDLFRFERRLITHELLRAQPDLVHAHWAYEYALAAQASGLPTLVTLHDAPKVVLHHTRSAYRALRGLMAARVMRRAPYLTAPSAYLAELLQPDCKAQITVVPNPIAPYVAARTEVRAHARGRRIAMICNGWDRRKNPEVGLRAFAAFRTTPAGQGAELHLFGHGFGPGQQAETWARAMQLAPGCTFHGPMPHRTLMERLPTMDVLLHPSLEESFGVVLAEAMCMGVPVVAGAHSGAVPWVLGAAPGRGDAAQNVAGVLADVRSPEAVAQALETVFDAEYGERSARGAARALTLFAPRAVSQAYEAEYRRVLGGFPAMSA